MGLVSAIVLGLSAVPAGATLVCPPGTTNPKYCLNVPPIATTAGAVPITGTTATLRGASGPGVPGGDITNYFFQYGKTRSYGQQTPTGTVGHCLGGATRCSSVPSSARVNAKIRHLVPCTRYNFRVVSKNSDGTTLGNNAKFRTRFARPIKRVKTPRHVTHRHFFKVKVTLSYGANVTISLRRHGHTVKRYKLGFRGPGSFSKKIKAPRTRGKYTLSVFARLSCGAEVFSRTLRVR
jgi:hypothetical protein